MRQGLPVDERGGDHGGPNAACAQRPQLCVEPVQIAQRQVGDGQQATTTFLRHVDRPPVPRTEVGLLRGLVVLEHQLPSEPVVREQHRGVHTRLVQLPQSRRRLFVRRGSDLPVLQLCGFTVA